MKKTTPERARRAVERARSAENAALRAYDVRVHTLRARERDLLLACGWLEESRYCGPLVPCQHAYRRPGGSRWHTLHEALLAQEKRDEAGAVIDDLDDLGDELLEAAEAAE